MIALNYNIANSNFQWSYFADDNLESIFTIQCSRLMCISLLNVYILMKAKFAVKILDSACDVTGKSAKFTSLEIKLPYIYMVSRDS